MISAKPVAFGKTVFTGNALAFANVFDSMNVSANAMKNTADDRAVSFTHSMQQDGDNMVFTADNNPQAERALTYGALMYQFMFDASASPLLIQSDSLDEDGFEAVVQEIAGTTNLSRNTMNYTFEVLA